MAETRKLAAILAADVVGYCRLAGAEEDRTLARLRALRSDLVDPTIAVHHGRVVKRTGDGALVEFRSVVDAVRCAIEVQNGMVERNAGLPPERKIEFRIGIHLGDVVEEADGDLMGDGVNIAARIEAIADPGGISLSHAAYEQVRDKVAQNFVDRGEQSLKNIARPIRVYALARAAEPATGAAPATPSAPAPAAPQTPEKPSIAVLPFQNMSGHAEQEHFCDGLVEDIITTLSKLAGLRVIARNSSFVYKGRSVDVREAAKQLGVRYILEGGVRKSGNRIRITSQLIDASDGTHLSAERYDRSIDDIFAIQDEIALILATEMQVKLTDGEQVRLRYTTTNNVEAWTCWVQGLFYYRQGLNEEIAARRGSGGRRPWRSIRTRGCSMPCSASCITPMPASAGGTIAKRQSAKRALTSSARSPSIRTSPTPTSRSAFFRFGRMPTRRLRPRRAKPSSLRPVRPISSTARALCSARPDTPKKLWRSAKSR